jgi:hypothetical protein
MCYIHTYIHTYHLRFIPEGQRHLRYTSETRTFYQNDIAMRNTTEVTGSKSVAPSDRSLSQVLFLFQYTTRDDVVMYFILSHRIASHFITLYFNYISFVIRSETYSCISYHIKTKLLPAICTYVCLNL